MKNFLQKYKLALILLGVSALFFIAAIACVSQVHIDLFCGYGGTYCPPADPNEGLFATLALVFMGLTALSALAALIAAFIKSSHKLIFAIVVFIPVVIWLINQYINAHPSG